MRVVCGAFRANGQGGLLAGLRGADLDGSGQSFVARVWNTSRVPPAPWSTEEGIPRVGGRVGGLCRGGCS